MSHCILPSGFLLVLLRDTSFRNTGDQSDTLVSPLAKAPPALACLACTLLNIPEALNRCILDEKQIRISGPCSSFAAPNADGIGQSDDCDSGCR